MSKFIDFDKYKKVFYDNFYLDDYKIVVKIPLAKKKERKQTTKKQDSVKVEKFNLTKYTYLTAY
ncbi:MAG: hypothetical protein GF353_24620 [Candidatus Lokiarchaeota archaeon]|nr:hypothetical protein [Candidatus Lokiarchaeota archaeon]